jgi:FkbH-like protein
MNSLSEDLKLLTPRKRALLARLLFQQRTSNPEPRRIKRRADRSRARASFAQERMWVLSELSVAAGEEYHMKAALRLRGELDRQALEVSLNELIRRHEILRTRFEIEDGILYQIIAESYTLSLEETSNDDALAPLFDLQRLPLLRVGLTRTGELEWMLILVVHHLIGDGWSLAILESEIAELYNSLRDKRVANLGEVTAHYGDYAEWQREQMDGALLQEHLNWWKQTLAGSTGPIKLSRRDTVYAGSSTPDGLSCTLDADVTAAVRELAIATASTPFAVLLTALGIALNRWTGRKDLTIGTVAGHRPTPETDRMIGPFVNYVPLRFQVSDDDTFAALIERIRDCTFRAFEHADCPFEKVVEALNPGRGGNPLYNVGFLLQNFPSFYRDWKGLEISHADLGIQASPLDLFWTVVDVEGCFEIHCHFRLSILDREAARQLLDSYQRTIRAVVKKECERVSELPLFDGCDEGMRVLRVAATFAADPIIEPLRFWMRKLELPFEVELAPYNQVFQQLLKAGSSFQGHQRSINVVLLRVEDWHDRLNVKMRELAAALLRKETCQTIVILCPHSSRVIADSGAAQSVAAAEAELVGLVAEASHIETITWQQVSEYYPVANPLDETADRLGSVPYTAVCFTAMATMIARRIRAISTPSYKVVVVDADDTLWDGVCGEVGPHGIVLSDARRYLHDFLLRQRDNGMLLCLSSKNDEAIVRETFAAHPEMTLQARHFASWMVNWKSKAENVRAIAGQLNLGLDSFIFLDNSEIECADVAAFCPKVLCLRLPSEQSRIVRFLQNAWAFDRPRPASGFDRNRFYEENTARLEDQPRFETPDEFIDSLEIVTDIQEMRPSDIARVSELTMRTNQFNCAPKSRTTAEVGLLGSSGRFKILTVRVRDRFGDYGLCGLMIFSTRGEFLEVDTFLLSCRTLGRRVEDRMLSRLREEAGARGLSGAVFSVVTTERNQPAREFLERVGSRANDFKERVFVDAESTAKAIHASCSAE